MLTDSSKIGLTNRFVVTMSGKSEYDLGSWTKVDGLDVTWKVAEYRTGDGGNDRLYFPGNTEYSNIKLHRAVSDETKKVRKWLDDNSWKAELFVGKVELFTSLHSDGPIVDWELRDVMPVKWNVGGFDASASAVSIETLELAHRGFLKDEMKLGG
jgi:phage tail-like protein